MVDQESAFGKFLEEKRKKQGFTLNDFAAKLNISSPYMNDIEKGRNYPPEKRLDEIASLLKLTEEEKTHMLDLAAMTRPKTIISDLRPLL